MVTPARRTERRRRGRGLPTVERLTAFRDTIAERVHTHIGNIAAVGVGAPAQLTVVANHLLLALINHEYQHDQWISEVRADKLGLALSCDLASDCISRVEGFLVCNPYA